MHYFGNLNKRSIVLAPVLMSLLFFNQGCSEESVNLQVAESDVTGVWVISASSARTRFNSDHTFVSSSLPGEIIARQRTLVGMQGEWKFVKGNNQHKPLLVLNVKKVTERSASSDFSLSLFFEDNKTLVFQQGDVDSQLTSTTFVFTKLE